MSLSTHVLDTTAGMPARGVAVVVDRWQDEGWGRLTEAKTDQDGRVEDLIAGQLEPGEHRIVFAIGAWYRKVGTDTIWTDITITFDVTEPEEHLHVPLLLSPHGYTTYRGS